MDLSDSSLHVSKIDSHEHQVDPVHQEESNVRGCNVLRLSLCTGHANGCDLRIKLCIGIFIVILVMIMVVIVTYRLSTRYGPKETSTLSQMNANKDFVELTCTVIDMAKYPPYKIMADNICVWTKSTIEQVLNSTKDTVFKLPCICNGT